MADRTTTAASYGGAVFSILSAMTLTEWGVIIGIATAIGTYLINRREKLHQIEMRKRIDSRDQELHELKMERLRKPEVCE